MVFRVLETTYQCDDELRSHRSQKIVELISEKDEQFFEVALRDDWYHNPIAIRDIINIVGLPLYNHSDSNNSDLGTIPQPLVLDNNAPYLLVLHPDILVTSTHLAEASSCLRRAVLRTLVDEYSLPNENANFGTLAVMGNLTHQLFQWCIEMNRWDDDAVRENIRVLIERNILMLWEVEATEEETTRELWDCSKLLKQWASIYIHSKPRDGANFSVHRSDPSNVNTHGVMSALAIHKVLDSEEFVWSPRFGLKGKVDVTVQGRIGAPINQTSLVSMRRETKVYPFELKTGKNARHHGHRAQLALYTLLLSDRYDIDITTGFLYYSKTGEMINVPALQDEIRGLFIMRNELAQHLNHNANGTNTVDVSLRLPELIRNQHACKYCPMLTGCLVYHASFENGTVETSSLPDSIWQAQVSHLTSSQLDFFKHWVTLIDQEERDMAKFRAELWTMESEERETKTGRCLSNMVIKSERVEDSGTVNKAHRYRVKFIRGDKSTTTTAVSKGQETFGETNGNLGTSDITGSLLGTQLHVGDPIIISSEAKRQYMFASGFVLDVLAHSLLVALDRPLRGIPVPCHWIRPPY